MPMPLPFALAGLSIFFAALLLLLSKCKAYLGSKILRAAVLEKT